MAPTAWEIQSRLAAILNFARQRGKSYVDAESNTPQAVSQFFPSLTAAWRFAVM